MNPVRPQPFSIIEVQGQKQCPVRVLLDGHQVADFPTWTAANAYAKALDDQRRLAEDHLKGTDPARYWELRYATLERLVDDLEASLEGHVDGFLQTFFERINTLSRNRANGRKTKPPRRSPLRQSIVSAMLQLRRDGKTQHETLVSLTTSPVGSLRVRKQGALYECHDEDHDWPSEHLTRDQMSTLFKAAK